MRRYRCKICGKIMEIEDINQIDRCPMCGASKELLEEVEEEIKEEVPRIEGPIPIDLDNEGIMRIEEKCIKCGLCSKICQDKVGISYNPDKSMLA